MSSRSALGLLGVALCALTACSSSNPPRRTSETAAPSSTSTSAAATTPTPTPTTSRRMSSPKPAPRPTTPQPSTSKHRVTHRPPAGSSGAPVIVLDPGHSVTISATDPATGLNVSDYENEPEMRDVYAVAQLVRSTLQGDGYRVIMTKTSLDERVSLGRRAAIARDAHADLALSIHDQAGGNGGIGFRAGNNIVYYQSVGTYRSTSTGKRVYFSDKSLAATSKRYGAIFQTQRNRVQGSSIRLQGDVGYDLGGRGLAGGNIWMVQLLSHVPWIYNEAGGNSAGQSGLDSADRMTYASALVASVEHCVAPPR